MTNTPNTTETRRPAKLSPPTDRDLEIFQHAQIHGRTHDAIALDFEISRRRVGQIVHDVRHWLSLHGTDDPVIYSQIQRQRLDRALERIYLKDIIPASSAIHGLNNAPPTLTTSTHINDHCVKKIMRDQPPVDSRLLKTLLQAVNSLGKLNERQPLPELPAQPWKHPKIQECLDDWRGKSKYYDFEPQDFDQFAQELTTTIQSCLGSPPTPSGTEAEDGLDSEDICPTTPLPPHPDPDPDPDPLPSAPSALPSASLPSLPEAPSRPAHRHRRTTPHPLAHQPLPTTPHPPNPPLPPPPLPSKNPKRETRPLTLSHPHPHTLKLSHPPTLTCSLPPPVPPLPSSPTKPTAAAVAQCVPCIRGSRRRRIGASSAPRGGRGGGT